MLGTPALAIVGPAMGLPLIALTGCLSVATRPDTAATNPIPKTADPEVALSWRDAVDLGL